MKRQRTYGNVLYSPLLHSLFTIRSTKEKNYRNFRLLVTPTHFDVQIDSNLTALAPRIVQDRGGRLSALRGLPMHQSMRLMTLSQRGDTDDSHAAHLLLHRPQSCTRHLCHVVLMVLRNGWCAATRYMISSRYALKIWRLRYR